MIWNQAVQKAKFGVALVSDVASKWSEQHQAAANAAGPRSTLTLEDRLATPPDEPANQAPVAQIWSDPVANG